MNVYDRIENKTAILADQEEALKYPWSAYRFSLLKIPGTDIEKCQEAACKDSRYAYNFALDVPGANVEYCQEHACKVKRNACLFARDIPDADIEYCRKACESDSFWLELLDKIIAEKVLA